MPRCLSSALLGAVAIGWGAIGWGIGGCSARAVSVDEEAASDLREIARAYEVVIAASQRPPRALDQINKVLTDLHTDGLVADEPADVLNSPRDGQSYVIILGADLGAQNSPEILAYEALGADGNRYVLLMSRDIRKMTDEEFAQAPFAMGHKPASGAKPAGE
jgi:hypothetical protein